MTDRFDLAVVGGGIHGCGVAQAAAAAGHSVVLLEQAGIASGTSSRSSKLIHGGLRYLEQLELGLVRECLHERALLLRLAPELVRLRPFVIPVYDDTSRGPWLVRLGLSLYALLAGLGRESRFTSLPRSGWPALDGLDTSGLRAVFRYADAQTDDAALTRAVMASARSMGASLLCPARVTALDRDDAGVAVSFRRNGKTGTLRAAAVVNAAGPWVNEVVALATPPAPKRDVELVQGSHLLFGERLGEAIYYVESPRDHRPVFLMPHPRGTLVGTTEATFRGDPSKASPSNAECEYLMQTVARYFPALADSPVVERFAGIRVLPADGGPANRRSRETILHPADNRAPRLLSIYGGKLTSYRATAEKVVRRLRGVLPERRRVARTDELALAPAPSSASAPGAYSREPD